MDLVERGIAAYREHHLVQAQEFFDNALSAAQTSEEQSIALYNLGLLSASLNDWKTAEKRFVETLRLIKNSPTIKEPQPDDVVSSLALVLVRTNRTDLALDRYIQLLESQRGLNRDAQDIARTLLNIGGLYGQTGRPYKALKYYLEAVEICRNRSTPDVLRCQALNNLGKTYVVLGQFSLAIVVLTESCDLAERLYGNDSTVAAVSLQNLASAYQGIGEFQKSESLFRQSLKILSDRAPSEPLERANCLGNLGLLYFATGALGKAEHMCAESVMVSQSLKEIDLGTTARLLNNLARVYAKLGKTSLAEKSFQQSIDFLENGNLKSELSAVVQNYVDYLILNHREEQARVIEQRYKYRSAEHTGANNP